MNDGITNAEHQALRNITAESEIKRLRNLLSGKTAVEMVIDAIEKDNRINEVFKHGLRRVK